MEVGSRVGFTSIRSPDWRMIPTQGFKTTIVPTFLNLQESHQPHSTTQNYSRTHPLHSPKQRNPICLTISATISTVLILLIILCRITLRWPTRGPKFWPGYLHLNPRDGTRTSEPAGSTKWETGFYKQRHIGIGLVVSARLNLVVQLCSATEVRESARLTLGKKNHT